MGWQVGNRQPATKAGAPPGRHGGCRVFFCFFLVSREISWDPMHLMAFHAAIMGFPYLRCTYIPPTQPRDIRGHLAYIPTYFR